MELVLSNEFEMVNEKEMIEIEGGFFGPVLFTIWGVKVMVGHCLAAGAAIGMAAGAAAN